jgi:DNA polymerase III delta prime subunit
VAALTFLEAFNAKELATVDIVASFVPSAQFNDLAGNWHSLLVGPRGSGKTTYLRMLELNALRFWSHADAQKYRDAISYTGIYVPADITWGAMVEALGGGQLKPECYDAFANAAFCTNVLQAGVAAMQCKFRQTKGAPYPDYQFHQLDPVEMESTVREIADAWMLPIKALSFQGLSSALGRRLLDLQSAALEVASDVQHSLAAAYERAEYLTLSYDEAITFALTEIDRRSGCTHGKWALLLDEFEIAPPRIQKLVLAKLRSSNPKLIYKVGLAPCGPHTQDSLDTSAPPSAGNDFRTVELWHRDKQASKTFCEKLFYAKVKDYSRLATKDPIEVFGQTYQSELEEEQRASKELWAVRWRDDFLELEAKDPSFKRFLIAKSINPKELDASASIARKLAPLVAFRNAHRRNDGVSNRKGRKKLFFAYTGWQAIAAITEGNPRWFIGILNMIASRIDQGEKLPVAAAIQHDQISAASDTFVAMLKTAATEQSMGISTKCLTKLESTLTNDLLKRTLSRSSHFRSMLIRGSTKISITPCVLHST